MRVKNIKRLNSIILVTSVLLGLAGCGSMSSRSIQTEEKASVSTVDDAAVEDDVENQNQEAEIFPGIESESSEEKDDGLDEMEVVNAIVFGNPKEVLDGMVITSNVEVKKTEEDELQIEFELENVGLCTFAASKGKDLILPDEIFVDSTKIEWTASTADGEYIFPYMKVNETGDMFLIDWTYHGYNFAIYGKSPQNTSDRDMAGKIALAIIYNLGEKQEEIPDAGGSPPV